MFSCYRHIIQSDEKLQYRTSHGYDLQTVQRDNSTTSRSRRAVLVRDSCVCVCVYVCVGK